MLSLVSRLPADEFSIDFLCLIGTGEWDGRAREIGAGVVHIGSRAESESPAPVRFAHRSMKVGRYVKAVRDGGYDIIDAWLYPADTFAVLMRRLTRTPIVMSGRRNVDPHDLFGPFDGLLDAVVARSADAIVANSGRVAAYATESQRAPASKLHVIRNGVELVGEPAEAVRIGWRRSFGASDADLVIGCVANYNPVKRLDLLIESFARLASDLDDVVLVLVGEGRQRPDLERRIRAAGLEGRVRLHGSVPDASQLYYAFDFVVQSSEREGLPNALLEAAACGRPIVATAAGGTSEIVLEGRTGIVVPVNDVDAMTAAMRRLASSELRARFGAAGRRHVADTFGMRRFVQEYATLYRELARRRGLLQGDA